MSQGIDSIPPYIPVLIGIHLSGDYKTNFQIITYPLRNKVQRGVHSNSNL